jgi:rhodanese-related sulfurtransferase
VAKIAPARDTGLRPVQAGGLYHRRWLASLLCGWIGATEVRAADGVQWTLVRHRIAKEFPHVPKLATGELAAWLAEEGRGKPILLDVRAPEEFAVSHLAGARRVDPEATAAQVPLPKDAPIVTYCSVGYRSAALAGRLRQAGCTRVQNLDGSIFQWANEDRPLVTEGKPATQVHPHSTLWGGLVKMERRAPMPGK